MKKYQNTIKTTRSQKALAKAEKGRYTKFKFLRREGVGGFYATGKEKDLYDYCFYNEFGELKEELPEICTGNFKYKLDGEFVVGLGYHYSKGSDCYMLRHVSESNHGWVDEAIHVAGVFDNTADGLNSAVCTAHIINMLHKEYGHECWYKYKSVKNLMTKCGFSEHEAFYTLPYVGYSFSIYFGSIKRSIKSVEDVIFWSDNMENIIDILPYNNIPEYLEEISSNFLALGMSKVVLDSVLLEVSNNTEMYLKNERNKQFYIDCYASLNFKGYWENLLNTSAAKLAGAGKNRLAKQTLEVYNGAFKIYAESWGFPIEKVTDIEESHGSSYRPFHIIQSKRLSKYIKGASSPNSIQGHLEGLFRSISDGITISDHYGEFMVVISEIDEIAQAVEDCKDLLQGRSIILTRDAASIHKFAESKFNSMEVFFAFEKYGLNGESADPDSDILIGDVSVTGMDAWLLPKNDLRNMTIGDMTGCCQHLGGAGERVCVEGWSDPYSANFVFGDKSEDKFYAHMWVWKTVDNRVVIDSIEGRSFVDAKKVSMLVLKIAQGFAKKGIKVILGSTSYGLTKDVVRFLKINGKLGEAIECPESMYDYSYMDTDPGDDCWEIVV